MRNIKKQLFKNWKIITSIGLLFVIVLGVLGYIALAPLQGDKAVNAIKYEYDNGIIFSGNGLVNKDQFKNFLRDLNYQFIQTKFDIFKPTYSLIRAQYYPKDNLQDNQKVHNVISIYLERKGLLDWKVIDTKDSAITGLSFSDTVSLASKYDLTTDFQGKDKYKITNYPPLTPAEIESNRKLSEIEDAQKRVEEQFNSTTPEGGKKLCEDDIQEAKNMLEAAKRGDKTFQAKRKLVVLSDYTIEQYEKAIVDLTEYCNN